MIPRNPTSQALEISSHELPKLPLWIIINSQEKNTEIIKTTELIRQKLMKLDCNLTFNYLVWKYRKLGIELEQASKFNDFKKNPLFYSNAPKKT